MVLLGVNSGARSWSWSWSWSWSSLSQELVLWTLLAPGLVGNGTLGANGPRPALTPGNRVACGTKGWLTLYCSPWCGDGLRELLEGVQLTARGRVRAKG